LIGLKFIGKKSPAALFSDGGCVSGGYAPRAKSVVFAAYCGAQLLPGAQFNV
jgi:hypothetical protein